MESLEDKILESARVARHAGYGALAKALEGHAEEVRSLVRETRKTKNRLNSVIETGNALSEHLHFYVASSSTKVGKETLETWKEMTKWIYPNTKA